VFPLAEQENRVSDFRADAASFVASRKGSARPQRDDSAGARYFDQDAVFHFEFTLGAAEEVFPPGRYVIETAESSYSASGHTAHVRNATMLIVPTASGTRTVPINIRELEAAMKQDSERQQRDAGGASPATTNPANPLPETMQSELARYGIERVPAEFFLWGGYRYSNAGDAIAAAKRAENR
jgi:hypothetical protein